MDMKSYYANAKAIYDWWRAQGFDDAFACGMLAQADHESSCDPTAVGDKGKASGLFQLHTDRARLINAGCGIDVTKLPPLEKQCEAVLWELHHSEKHALAMILAAATPFDAGVAACRYYERPGVGGGQDAKRGLTAQMWSLKFQQAAS